MHAGTRVQRSATMQPLATTREHDIAEEESLQQTNKKHVPLRVLASLQLLLRLVAVQCTVVQLGEVSQPSSPNPDA